MRQTIRRVRHSHQIQYIRLHQHSGLSKARNIGIANSNARWILTLDSDDRLASEAIACVSQIANQHVGLIVTDTLWLSDRQNDVRSKARFHRLFELYHGTILDPYVWFDFFYQGLIVLKEVALKARLYDQRMIVGEDLDLLLRVLESLRTDEVGYVEHPCYHYRFNTLGICETQWNAVKKNYEDSLLRAMRRRGGKFATCKFSGSWSIDNTETDSYSYSRLDGIRVTYPRRLIL